MGQLRFFRRVQLAPGVRLNLAKRGASISLGVRGAHLTVGRGGARRTLGLPGTGVFYTSAGGRHTGMHNALNFAPPPGPRGVPLRHVRGWLTIALIVLGLIVLAALGQMFGR